MNNDRGYIELVRQAQLGDKESLNTLAELVRGRLYAYVYRITLQDDIAQDIVQESMIEMVRMIDALKRAESFWPWLRRIAFNKICHFYRTKQFGRVISVPDLDDKVSPENDWEKTHQGLANLLGEELRQIIFKAIQRLNLQHRTVLTMRCYEKMEYSQIAELMERSEPAVRVLFHRAKKSLMKQLSRRGLRKSFLLSALVLFGKMTAPSEAAAAQVSVTSSTIGAGLRAALAGMASRETAAAAVKAACISVVAAGGFIAGSMVPTSWIDKTAEWTNKAATTIREKWSAGPVIVESQKVPINKSGEECWYYYPDKTGSVVMMRRVKYDSEGNQSDCWLQNERANYYFDGSDNTIYINNHRIFNSDLSVCQLPADDAELTGFLSTTEGKQWSSGYVYGDKDGLLVIVKRSENQGHCGTRIIYHYNVLDEEYFRYNWPAEAKVVDNRDAMHKWGWTYLRISGEIDGHQVSGVGQIPFVHAASKQHRPWLRLQADNGLKITDGVNGAYVYYPGSDVPVTYSASSFFKGLARPWAGLHTIDTIRRDAAREKLRFATKHTPDNTKAEVVIIEELEDKHIQANYIIDLEKDIINEITYSVMDGQGQVKEGSLRFDYLKEIDRVGNEFVEPREETVYEPQHQEPEMLWFARLGEGNLQ